MEPELSTAPLTTTPKKTPWGLFVGLLLILIVIVASAFYTFSQRLAVEHPAATSSVSQ